MENSFFLCVFFLLCLVNVKYNIYENYSVGNGYYGEIIVNSQSSRPSETLNKLQLNFEFSA